MKKKIAIWCLLSVIIGVSIYSIIFYYQRLIEKGGIFIKNGWDLFQFDYFKNCVIHMVIHSICLIFSIIIGIIVFKFNVGYNINLKQEIKEKKRKEKIQKYENKIKKLKED